MRPDHVDHVCAVCESTCDDVTALKRAVRILQGHVLLLGHALREERDLVGMARAEVDARFPQEEAA